MDLRALFTEICDSSGGGGSGGKSSRGKRNGKKEKLSGSRLARGLRHAGLPLDRAVIDLLIAAFSTAGGRGLHLSYADFHRMVHCDGLMAGGSAAAEMGGAGGYAGRPGTLEEQVRMGSGGVLDIMHGRSRMTIDPRIPTMPGRSTSGFHRPGRHCLHQARSAVRCPASRYFCSELMKQAVFRYEGCRTF